MQLLEITTEYQIAAQKLQMHANQMVRACKGFELDLCRECDSRARCDEVN